ncbi:hypothetical protein ABPG75_004688 [Micractinium tetrahymenae]
MSQSAKIYSGCSTACRRPPQQGTAAAAPARPACQRLAATASSARHDGAHTTPQQQDAASLDVSGAVVQPAFRSTPWDPRQAGGSAAAANPRVANVCLVSESGVCRCVLAAAALSGALQRRGLSAAFRLACRASRDYCLGQGPEPAAGQVAAELGWVLPEAYQAQQFQEARDITEFDMLLVMDKFVAADVLREVSVYDTIQTWGRGGYSSKVRRLGEFAPAAAAAAAAAAGGRGADPDAADIGDPLYGNMESEAELAAVRAAAAAIEESCEGLADFLAGVERHFREGQQAGQEEQEGQTAEASGGAALSEAAIDGGEASGSLGAALTAAVRQLGEMDWLVPPMLAPR